MNKLSTIAGMLLALAPAVAAHAQSPAPDWAAIAKSEITLFYPGQASFQWIMGKGPRQGRQGHCAGPELRLLP